MIFWYYIQAIVYEKCARRMLIGMGPWLSYIVYYYIFIAGYWDGISSIYQDQAAVLRACVWIAS